MARNLWTLDENYDYKKDGAIIDGNMIFKNKDEGDAFTLELYDYLFKVKRLPESVFILNCEFDKVIKRILDEDALKEE